MIAMILKRAGSLCFSFHPLDSSFLDLHISAPIVSHSKAVQSRSMGKTKELGGFFRRAGKPPGPPLVLGCLNGGIYAPPVGLPNPLGILTLSRPSALPGPRELAG